MKTALKNPYKPKIRLQMGAGYRFIDQIVKKIICIQSVRKPVAPISMNAGIGVRLRS